MYKEDIDDLDERDRLKNKQKLVIMKQTGFGNVGTIIEEEYDYFGGTGEASCQRVDNKLMKTSFKKSEVSNRLILNIDF